MNPAHLMRLALAGGLLLFILSCAAPPQTAPSLDEPAAKLPSSSLYQIEASWQDQDDHSRHPADLRGKVVVTAMIFTHCQYACPLIVADLKRMEAQLSPEVLGEVEWLLVSMDAERDTPPVLASYAAERGLDLDRWTLWHGDASAVRTWAAALGVNYRQNPNGSFSHSNLITVLDREGRVAYRLEGLNADNEACLAAIRAEAAN